ncbi:MAG TPA: hypothetical protein VED87_03270 [Methylocystis sp.]|nr:hypothetical protein [Methylocystis sp.]
MESVVNWFQDWSDACQYANECAPDLSFVRHLEPWSAFAAIALTVFAVWAWNEKGLKKLLENERRYGAAAAAEPCSKLSPVLDRMKDASARRQQQAA